MDYTKVAVGAAVLFILVVVGVLIAFWVAEMSRWPARRTGVSSMDSMERLRRFRSNPLFFANPTF
jgi:hypothetical protein